MKRIIKRSFVYASLFLLLASSSYAKLGYKNVESVKKRWSFLHNKKIRVEGYIEDTEYFPFGMGGILYIRLFDKIEKEEGKEDTQELEEKEEKDTQELEEKSLLCEENGFNISTLRRTHELAELLKKKGEKVWVEGRYDKNMGMLYLEEIMYERDKKECKIDTDEGDFTLFDLAKTIGENIKVQIVGVSRGR